MPSIGSFGVVHDALDLTFDYFGHTVRVNPLVSDMVAIEFLAEASKIDQADQVTAAQMTMCMVRECVHADDWDLFWSLVRANRQTQEELMAVCKAVMEAASGFPTGPSAGSSPTPSTDGRKFEVDVPATGIAQAPQLSPEALRALNALVERPDLGAAVLAAAEARAPASV